MVTILFFSDFASFAYNILMLTMISVGKQNVVDIVFFFLMGPFQDDFVRALGCQSMSASNDFLPSVCLF